MHFSCLLAFVTHYFLHRGVLLAGGQDHARTGGNRQDADVALGDRLLEQVELLRRQLVVLVVDVALLAEDRDERLDALQLGLNRLVGDLLGLVLGLSDLLGGQRTGDRVGDVRLLDLHLEVNKVRTTGQALHRTGEVLLDGLLEAGASLAVVQAEVRAVVTLECVRGGPLQGLLDVHVQHGVPAGVVLVAAVADPGRVRLAAPLLDADLLVELLEDLAVGIQVERHRAAEAEGDVVLDDLDRGAVVAGSLGLLLGVATELVGPLTGRVQVVPVAGAVVAGAVLALDTEAVRDGLVGTEDEVVIDVHPDLVGLRSVAGATGHGDAGAQHEGGDGGALEAVLVHDSSFRMDLSQSSSGVAYSLGMRSTGSLSNCETMLAPISSWFCCAASNSAIRGSMSSNCRSCGATRAN